MSASCALHTGSPFSLPSAASWLSGKCRLRIERLTRNIRILSLLSNKIQYVKLGKFATTVQVRRYSLQLFIYSSNIFLSRVTLRYREKTDLTPSPGRRLYFEVPLRAHISSNVGHRSPHPPCEGSAIVEGEVADAGFIFVPSSFFIGGFWSGRHSRDNEGARSRSTPTRRYVHRLLRITKARLVRKHWL